MGSRLTVAVYFSQQLFKVLRKRPTLSHPFFTHPPIAQLVEQIALNDKVLGSIPSGRTNIGRLFGEEPLHSRIPRDLDVFAVDEEVRD